MRFSAALLALSATGVFAAPTVESEASSLESRTFDICFGEFGQCWNFFGLLTKCPSRPKKCHGFLGLPATCPRQDNYQPPPVKCKGYDDKDCDCPKYPWRQPPRTCYNRHGYRTRCPDFPPPPPPCPAPPKSPPKPSPKPPKHCYDKDGHYTTCIPPPPPKSCYDSDGQSCGCPPVRPPVQCYDEDKASCKCHKY